ncbi:YceI family protein [Spongiimicrobium sp. 2-473A-2-J]|uniref:YceI family protein n=1 Tax=Eudoraea algarum TaxID=3417568 RepID=UPI003D35DC4D
MKLRNVLFLALAICALNTTAQTYNIDPGHSAVQIQVERFGVIDVSGRFKDVQGSITYDADDLSAMSAQAVIKVESYDANNPGGEEAVKSKAFLDQVSFPEIRFQSIGVNQREGKQYLIGNLTIKGVTKEIALPFTIKGPLPDLPTKKQSIAFEGGITINRLDYGIPFDRKLPNGTSLIGNDVKITLLILALAE